MAGHAISAEYTKTQQHGEVIAMISSLGEKRCSIFIAKKMAILTGALLLVALPSFAGHEFSLPGSDFEIDADANLIVDVDPAPSGRPSLDWANVTEIRKADDPSGKNDNSFGQGAKEDTLVPTVVTGSIPPNKSDLLYFGVFEEASVDGNFLHLFWTRVQDPKGTTNMDFEFNQSATLSANGVTPARTPGDLLIVYELAKGGTVPRLFLFRWLDGSEGLPCEASNTFPCWGARTDLSAAGDATGSINSSFIDAADGDGLGSLDPRTFGEASIDLSAVFPDPNVCQSFGQAYVKSRSSDSFTAALKDFIGPQAVLVANCGSVTINKINVATEGPLPGAVFTLYNDVDQSGTFDDAIDTSTGESCTTDSEGNCTIDDILPGDYCVVETELPTGFFPVGPTAQCFSVDFNETFTFEFLNTPGA